MNENQITCDICRDLIPLVKDGVAGSDSEAAVRRHIEDCEKCAVFFDEIPASEMPEMSKISKTVPSRVFLRAKRRLTFVYAAVLLLGIFYAEAFTGSREMFISWLIMPFAGVFGYLVFRWKTALIIPLMLVPLKLMNENLLLYSGECFDDAELFTWALFYYLLALAGMIITALLRFAFGKSSLDGLDILESGEKNENNEN